MTDSYDNKPISTFEEICHLTIKTMCQMDLETLMQLRKQVVRELDRAKLTKGFIDAALSLRQSELDRASAQANDNQQNLFDGDDA